MHKEISQLFMYGDLDKTSILYQMGEIFGRFESGNYNESDLIRDIKTQLKRLLILATDYGYDHNLWHNYIAFFLITNENPFSLVCEKNRIKEGTVNTLVQEDFALMRKIFLYDFGPIEKAMNINSFSLISNYKAVSKEKKIYNWNVSEKVQALSEKLEGAKDDKDFSREVVDFYHDYGVGLFGLNKAFRIDENPSQKIESANPESPKNNNNNIVLSPINNMDMVTLDDLVGYELQKQKLIDNTEAFVGGSKANNVLLFGDSGTGKSTSIKAIVNQYYDRGLRMIEIYKHQFRHLSTIISMIKKRNYKFIIYMDDLSFEEHEIEYKYLKAVIEGGAETKPDNILLYATSNRRHLIRETWNDKDDHTNQDDIHHSDTVEEKLSLADRFGITIWYPKPMREEYSNIVLTLSRKAGITMDDDELILEATRWEMSHGGISGRTAQQFINYLVYQQEKD